MLRNWRRFYFSYGTIPKQISTYMSRVLKITIRQFTVADRCTWVGFVTTHICDVYTKSLNNKKYCTLTKNCDYTL